MSAITPGSKVVYTQPSGIPAGVLDSNVVLDAGDGSRVGRCTLDLTRRSKGQGRSRRIGDSTGDVSAKERDMRVLIEWRKEATEHTGSAELNGIAGEPTIYAHTRDNSDPNLDPRASPAVKEVTGGRRLRRRYREPFGRHQHLYRAGQHLRNQDLRGQRRGAPSAGPLSLGLQHHGHRRQRLVGHSELVAYGQVVDRQRDVHDDQHRDWEREGHVPGAGRPSEVHKRQPESAFGSTTVTIGDMPPHVYSVTWSLQR
jgi:hypothetical protein